MSTGQRDGGGSAVPAVDETENSAPAKPTIRRERAEHERAAQQAQAYREQLAMPEGPPLALGVDEIQRDDQRPRAARSAPQCQCERACHRGDRHSARALGDRVELRDDHDVEAFGQIKAHRRKPCEDMRLAEQRRTHDDDERERRKECPYHEEGDAGRGERHVLLDHRERTSSQHIAPATARDLGGTAGAAFRLRQAPSRRARPVCSTRVRHRVCCRSAHHPGPACRARTSRASPDRLRFRPGRRRTRMLPSA